ncbi:hypothetical protein [Granulicella tundricola]|uniref:RiboL-PSP-HEPN domain-containing protein n=1 Tax=Granulicella tundricola (strain ATCC BAA-1859 / DSM 23138 / MP5ACTX9) TaxID=1198114 RepID=E8WXF4_GRATM|nr:hypothetical protein [Granulicella tundricola]ADW67487.1 hypothetical protein AciX9_0415 [Granulicella tundricola MP5ACTX9]
MSKTPSYIDRSSLPASFPTNSHSPIFWEQLGRTIATFGFLEEILGKAIFVLTGTRSYGESEIEDAFENWTIVLEKALSDTLKPLAKTYGQALKSHHDPTPQNIDGLIQKIEDAADIRNILCHASWHIPDADGRSLPFFVNRRKEVVTMKLNTLGLLQIQEKVVELACDVIDTITQMGFQFPGSGGIGEKLWPL